MKNQAHLHMPLIFFEHLLNVPTVLSEAQSAAAVCGLFPLENP